jgi:hypothetical protein
MGMPKYREASSTTAQVELLETLRTSGVMVEQKIV